MYKLFLLLCIYGILSCSETSKKNDTENLRTIVKCALDTITSDPWFLSDYYQYLSHFTLLPQKSEIFDSTNQAGMTNEHYTKMSLIPLDTNVMKKLHDIFPKYESLKFMDINSAEKYIRNDIIPVSHGFWVIGDFRKLNDLYFIEIGYVLSRRSGDKARLIIQLSSENTCKIIEKEMVGSP